METVIKVKGIMRRWLTNIMLSVIAGVVLFETVFGFFIYSYFCNSASSQADGYARYFTGLSYSSADSFYSDAKQYVESFQHSDEVRVQVIDSAGSVVADTAGVMARADDMPDYNEAIKSQNGTGSYIGNSKLGERIMSETFLLSDTKNGSNGAIRWSISMTPIYKYFAISMTVAILLGGVVIIIAFYSGRYFNRSIVVPVREASKTARRIAMGDFKARLQVTESDEIGELCDTINYMANELNTAEELKNDFIFSVSHELRTPLTAIKGWGETALMSLGTDQELVEKGINVILTEADRLQGLVEELLDFSRIQSSRLSVNVSLIDISEILDETAEMYDEIARQHNIEIKVTRPYELPPVLGDLNRLKQVFINVIDNAVKYTVSDGYVDINVSVEEEFIRIMVKDTGVGIAEKDIDRVKEKFYKANKTIRGSGIGLAVADEILKQHNGLLFIESEENVGTTVTIVLSVAPKEDSEEIAENKDIKPTEINADATNVQETEDGAEETEEVKEEETEKAEESESE